MQKKFQDVICACNKPLLTVNCGKGITITALGAAVILFLIAFHVSMCKLHAFCTKCKLKKNCEK